MQPELQPQTKTLALEIIDPAQLNTSIQQVQEYSQQQAWRLSVAVKSVEDTGIHSKVELDRANEILGAIVDASATVEERWEAPIAFFRKAHQTLTGWRKRELSLFEALRARIEAPMKAFIAAHEAEERRRQEEAERAALLLRKAKEAEAKRLAKQGELGAAMLAKEMAAAIVAPTIPTEEIKLEGNAIRKQWEVTVTDPMALIKAVAEGAAPIEVIKDFDESFLKRRAAERGSDGELFPGVTAKQVIGFAVRRQRI